MATISDNQLTEDQQTQVCDLLETYSYIIDEKALAEYLDCSPKALSYFLRMTRRAKAAQARYLDGSREASKRNLLTNDRTHQELALPDKLPDGMQYVDVIPDEIVGAYAIKHGRNG